MTAKRGETEVFSPVLFGRIIREARRLAGYSNTTKFSEGIQLHTNIFIDPDTLLRVERGERELDVTKTLAVAVTIWGTDWVTELPTALVRSMPEKTRLKTGTAQGIVSLKEGAELQELRALVQLADSLDVPPAEARVIREAADMLRLKRLGTYAQTSPEYKERAEELSEMLDNSLTRMQSGLTEES